MSRITKTITISLPPEMAAKIEELSREEARTKSELLREALRRYVEEREWSKAYRYGEMKAREKGITEEEVDKLIHARRARKGQVKVSLGQ